jgi:hypothetical protein
MDLRRVGTWQWLAALAGLVLLISLWLPWYGVVGLNASAWQAFTFVDLLLALAGLLALALVPVVANQRAVEAARLMTSIVFWVGLAAAVFALIRLINVPGVDTTLAGGAADITRKAGGFIAAVAAIGLALFAWLGRRDPQFPGPLRTHPDVERLPSPTAEESQRQL